MTAIPALTASALAFLLLGAPRDAGAFLPSTSIFAAPRASSHSSFSSSSSSSPSTTLLHSEVDRVKSVGGGIPASYPSGNRALFDPAEEGMLQGTGSLDARISAGSSFELPVSSPLDASALLTADGVPDGAVVRAAQNYLEYLDDAPGRLPLNYARPSDPARATLLARDRIIGPSAPGDIQHVVLRLPEGMHYVEGQSLSVVPPGIDPKNGRPHKPRLYSIASTRYGDAADGTTVSLCVRRAEYYDPVTGHVDPSRKGVCSNFLCDAAPGTVVNVAGPVGKTMVLPRDSNRDVIMIATGTGVAPFRAFLHRLFMEDTVARHMFGGTAWLVLGVPVRDGLLYEQEIDAMMRNAGPGQLQVDYAISREMTNSIDGGKMYVQHVIAQKADELFARLDSGANVYFCGLKGMMPPILETMEKVAAARGVDWSTKLKELKDNHQWHVEVY